MKTKRFLALLTALVMVLAVMPGLAFAADVADTVTVEATKTATHNVKGSGSATDDVTLGSYPSSSLFVYHSNWNQRNAYVGFDLSNAFSADQLSGKKVVKKATLSLNCAEADIGSTVSIVAIDNSKWKESEYVKPEDLGLPAHNITSSTTVVPGDMVVLSEQTVNNTGTYDFDVTEYVAENFVSLKDTGISFAVININTTTSTGEIIKVLFEGKDGSVKPKLTVELADVCTFELTLKSGDTSLRAKTVTSYVGDQYIPSDEDAPLVVEKDGEYYTRNELKALELTEGTNSYTAEYTKTSIDLDSIKNPDDISVIEGDKPFLPKTLSATLADGKNTVDVPVTWQETDTGYTTTVGGKDINIKLETLRCDHSIDVKDDSKKDHIYNGGNSDGAQFVWNNKLGTTYAGGNVIFDTTFTISEGTNKLISYGNETTSTFDGTGPIVRFMNKSVFEYHDTAWKDSNVPCETGKT